MLMLQWVQYNTVLEHEQQYGDEMKELSMTGSYYKSHSGDH